MKFDLLSHSRNRTFAAAMFVILGSGCHGARWNGRVESWGGMRAVMREGRTEARVSLTELAGAAHVYGVGAVEGLRGEILIDDGRCWVGQVGADGSPTITDRSTDGATLLAVAYVPAWTTTDVGRAVSAEELEPFVLGAAQRAGIDSSRPFPFVIDGELRDLQGHIINGRCALPGMSEGGADSKEALRVTYQSCVGKLVGFYAQDAAGELTHHGSSTHVHVLVGSPPHLVAHVDSVGLGPSARIGTPIR